MLHKVRLNDKTMQHRERKRDASKHINQFENILIEMHYAFICHRAALCPKITPYTIVAICDQNQLITFKKDFRGVSN